MATVAELAGRVLRRLGVTVVAPGERPGLTATVLAADIATRALQWLGVVAADEVPSPSDQAMALSRVEAVHDGLVAQGIVSWAIGAIPQSVAEDYVMLVVLHLASAFGKPADAAQEAVRETRIRRVSMQMRAPALAEQAIMDVHSTLDARGLTRWGVFDVPDYVDGSYVMLAANLVAPQFGLPPDPLADDRAMRDIVRVIALGTGGERVRAEYF